MLLTPDAARAVDYILAHLEAAPTVEEVAGHCHFSKWHFSRLFKAETGESPHAFIRRLRLEESAFRLKVEPGRAVTDIGYDCGYSPSNYSWAFRQRFGEGPAAFRRGALEGSFRHPFCHLTPGESKGLLTRRGGAAVRQLPELTVLCQRRIGNYHQLGELWGEFLEYCLPWRSSSSRFLLRSFDDPSITRPDGCLYDLCMTVPPGLSGPGVSRIPGGSYLVCPFRGPVWHIFPAYQAIFNFWLPQSPYRLRGPYSYDLYHSLEGGPEDVELDICIPVVKEPHKIRR